MSFHTTTLYEPHSNMSLEFTRKQSIKYSFLLDPQLQKTAYAVKQQKKCVQLTNECLAIEVCNERHLQAAFTTADEASNFHRATTLQELFKPEELDNHK